MLCLVAQSCPTVCDPMDCTPPGSSVHVDSPGKNTGVGGHALLQGIFQAQGSNSGLPHCFTSRGRTVGTPLKLRRETQGPFPVATGILGFLSIIKRSQASSPFKALNSDFLSCCQRAVRPLVVMRQGARAFSRVSTGDSDIPSSWEMQDEPAFKSLQGNPALCRVRESQCPFHLRLQTQGPSHIPIAE